MNFKKIIIYRYETLFNILSEISDCFNLSLIKTDKENIDELTKGLKNDFLIISKEKVYDFKNQLQIDKLPIKIEKLITACLAKVTKPSDPISFTKSYCKNKSDIFKNNSDFLVNK